MNKSYLALSLLAPFAAQAAHAAKKEAHYLFTQAAIPRALPAEAFAAQAQQQGLQGSVCPSVKQAVRAALEAADPDDCIFIGGSTFIVAEAIPLFPRDFIRHFPGFPRDFKHLQTDAK